MGFPRQLHASRSQKRSEFWSPSRVPKRRQFWRTPKLTFILRLDLDVAGFLNPVLRPCERDAAKLGQSKAAATQGCLVAVAISRAFATTSASKNKERADVRHPRVQRLSKVRVAVYGASRRWKPPNSHPNRREFGCVNRQ